MAPKTTRAAAGALAVPAAPAAPRVKVPKQFIARPSRSTSHRALCKVYLDGAVLEAMGLVSGAVVRVRADAAGGVVATAHPADEVADLEADPKVVYVSHELLRLGGFLLGDRLEVARIAQPKYAAAVAVARRDGGALDLAPKIEKALEAIGIVHEGVVFTVGEEEMVVTEVQQDVAAALGGLLLGEGQRAAAGALLFHRGRTAVTAGTAPAAPAAPCAPFAAVGGLAPQIELLRSTIELPLHHPTLFADFGITPPRGILLHGPPGTGKTMLLRCVAAASANVHVLSINGPSIVSKYLGETETAIRDIFEEAVRFQPLIIFMDEIDSLAPSRGLDDSGETELRVVATLLTLMDGMGSGGRVVVVGATNRPNALDAALRRPGRFDQEVEIGIPDAEARFDILCKQFDRMNRRKHTLDRADIGAIAAKTHGYVGADLTALCRELVMKAIVRGKRDEVAQLQLVVGPADVEAALAEITPLAMREIFLEMPKVYWSDIGGQHELKRKLMEVVQLPLEAAATFERLGVAAPRGVLLYGPPGCSKTLTAKALATELGLNFLAVKGPEILNKYVGESERTIREIFRKARAALPLIIFFDEIDAILGDRDSLNAAQNVLTSLLNEIDGVEELKGVVVVAATNRPTEIDAALLRPGRLDRHIYVAPPDRDARLQILTNGCRKFGEASGVDLGEIARVTEGCLGAEVALLCQEAGLAAIMEDRNAAAVHKRHFDHALAGISRGITAEMLAYYEEFAGRSGLHL